MPRFLLLRRRPTPIALALSAMAILLGVLAVLQYRWVGQLSTDERERLGRRLDRQAEEFTDEFNLELTKAYFSLQWGAELRRDQPVEADVARYERWYASAQRPELVKAIYRLSEPATDKAPWLVERFERGPGRLVAVDWPAELAEVRASVEKSRQARVHGGPLHRVPPAWADIPALLIPRLLTTFEDRGGGARLVALGGPVVGYTVAVLDEKWLKAELLPLLVERHFALSKDPSVHVGVYGARFAFTPSGPLTPEALRASPDVSEDLFEIRFGEFRRLVRFETSAPGDAATAGGSRAAGPSPQPTGPIPVPPPGGPLVSARDGRAVNVFRGGGPGGPDNSPRWKVHVLHRAGSLDAVVANVRTRNLLVSFGVLVLLGASMGLVLITTGRARRLAAQQLEFVAGVSHELRTPLAVIRSAAENLADGVIAEPKQVKRYGEVIVGEGRRLTHMVEQIMEFAGFESGRASLDVRPVAPGGLIEEALGAAAPHLREHQATIERTGVAELPAVLVDAGAVSRSLQNLIVNALKYGGSPPRVVVDVRPGEPGRREVNLTVTDNGAGIAARDLPHIFEPFYRGVDARSRQIHGSGLGLSLVKRIMDEIGGRVTVRTDAKGSAFTLHLPIAPEGARETGRAGQATAAPSLSS